MQLVEALADTGFASEVRPGEGSSILVFLRFAKLKFFRKKDDFPI